MSKHIFLPLACLLIAALLLFIPFRVEPYGYLAGEWLDFLHLPFATIVYFSFWMILRVFSMPGQRAWISFGLSVALLVGAEFLQDLAGRSFSYPDMMYDLLGVVLGLMMVRSKMNIPAMILILLLGLAGPLYSSWMVWGMNQRWPQIAGFNEPAETRFVELLGVEALHHGDYITTGDVAFPSIFIEHPRKDWSEYSSFTLSLRLETGQVVTVRMDDRIKTEGYAERYQREFILPAGNHELCISLREGFTTSGGRAMDLDSMYRVGVIFEGGKAGNKISLQKLELNQTECY